MKTNSTKKIRLTFVFIIVITLLSGLLDFPQYLNKTVSWTNIQLDKLKYLDQINIPSVNLIPFSLGLDLKGGAHLVYKADVSSIAGSDQEEAIEGVRDVIERRVNAIGVSEPEVQTSKVGGEWRVIVEIPGITDVSNAIALIGETPILEFKEFSKNSDFDLTEEQQQMLDESKDNTKKAIEEIKIAIKAGESFEELAKKYSQDNTATNGGDLDFAQKGTFVKEFEKTLFEDLKVGEITQDPIKTDFGWHFIKKEEERGEGDDLEVRGRHILLRELTEADIVGATDIWTNTKLSGKHLKNAAVAFDPNTNQPQISLNFDAEGSDLFAQITERNIGSPVGIFLDGDPITVPTVRERIDSGSAVITGDFTLPEARDLARRLNAGALPVPIELIMQQKVGATLGQESLDKSLNAGIIGLILVIIFMVLYYRLPGIISVFSLSVYALILLALFKYIPVTLTLAGIAGFILSFGMAVDANVLVFERLKEELADGKPLGHAVEEAFKRAWTSIRDGNVSTLITCFILIWFSTSSVKGFAITLALGILVSLFSAVFVTRVVLRIFIRYNFFKKPFLWGTK